MGNIFCRDPTNGLFSLVSMVDYKGRLRGRGGLVMVGGEVEGGLMFCRG